MPEIRLRYCGKRERFDVPDEARADTLRAMAKALTVAECDPERAERILRDAATAKPDQLRALVAYVEAETAAGLPAAKAAQPAGPTFRTVGEEWTSGDFHKRFPDQVEAIFHDFNIQRLERHVYPVIGPKPIRSVTRADCDDVMRALPDVVKSRRHIAALVNRVLNLAELAGYIDRNPLPRGWLPKPLPKKLWAVLYPAEDRAMLACVPTSEKPGIPLCYRILYGFLHREGMRKGEATALRWRALDLDNGQVELDANKTDHARSWELDPGVVVALKRWHELRGKPGPDERVFTDEAGGPWVSEHMAATLRLHLKRAELERAALYDKGDLRGRFGLHSFRRSFITRSLALGRSSDWVTARSGHETDAMLRRYRQRAKGLADRLLAELDPLDRAIPELAPDPVPTKPDPSPEPPAGGKTWPSPGPKGGPEMHSEGGGTGRRTSLRC